MIFEDSSIITIGASEPLTTLQVLLYAIMGILIVITILALIFLILILVMPLFAKIGSAKSKKQVDTTTKTEITPVVTEEVSNNNDEIVAVIIAAISASQNISSDRFRVVSFKKI